MKNIRNTFIYLLLLFFPMLALSTPGPYIKVEGGKLDSVSFFFGGVSGYGGRVATGYLWGQYKFNYGLESGFMLYPHLSGNDSFFGFFSVPKTLSGYNVDLAAIIKYKFDSNFLVLAKAGAVYANQQSTISYYYTKCQTKHSSIAPEIALGIGYQLSPKTEISLTASLSASSHSTDAISALLLGVSYSL